VGADGGDRLQARVRSFGYAFRGVGRMLREEPNARIHAVATLLVAGLGLALDVGRLEWCALVLAMGFVWSAEALNTALESMCDVASLERHPGIERAKDAAAGAVLLAAIGAALVGLLVLGPPLLAALFTGPA